MTRNWWRYGVIPSGSKPCRAIVTVRASESQSSKVSKWRLVGDIRRPNLSQNSSGLCTFWWARTRPRNRGSRIATEVEQILDCWKFWANILAEFCTLYSDGIRGGDCSFGSARKWPSHWDIRHTLRHQRSIGERPFRCVVACFRLCCCG